MADAPVPAVALREVLGAVRTTRDIVRVSGPDSVSFLHGQLSQDIESLAIGASALSFLLQPQGKVDAWLRVSRRSDDAFVVDVETGFGSSVRDRLLRFKLRVKVDIGEVEEVPALALRGPGASAVVVADEAGRDCVSADAGWPGIEGADLFVPGEPIDVADVRTADGSPVPEATNDELEVLRLACGVPRMGAEISDATIPAELGQWVIDASVSFTKGCYTGQELVARIDSRGGNVPRRLTGLVVDGSVVPRVGAVIDVDGAEVGVVTSAVFDPTRGAAIGLAFIKRSVTPPAVGAVVGDEATLTAQLHALPLLAEGAPAPAPAN